jgi:hypothetical protein
MILAAAAAADARNRATSHRPSCNFAGPNPNAPPTALSSALDQGVLNIFAVLRRPSQPSDALPPINPLGFSLGFELGRYYPGYIRKLSADSDGSYYLIPGFARSFPIPPARCLPKSLRRHRAQLVAQQRKLANEPVYCLAEIGPHTSAYGAGANCEPFADIASAKLLLGTALATSQVGDLAPDGVATARLTYRGGATIDAPVANNFYTFTPPQGPVKRVLAKLKPIELKLVSSHLGKRQRERLLRQFGTVQRTIARLAPKQVEWLDASGNRLRVINLPAHGTGGATFGSLTGSFGVTLSG